ncbi:D-alanine--D-alanine ligase family protein [Kineosporia babensis]|uniref:D-alanine--D-alanine ligase n=1 Tax=Kineosporia babensis TaxID=499548 RepID=A0A9X1SWE7_9ACTN|nr:D-alanine--D-alanine ligase family protein [Kineosporia babensis]MCD5314679.1 D-alanine--D-alanine ligase [Kineosporia babensis]
MSIRVAVIGGGRNCEHEVSLASALSVEEALRHNDYQVVRLTVDRAGVWRDAELRPIGLAGAVRVLGTCDVVVPMLHGPHGEDGTLAALCDLAQLPYVGSGLRTGALAMDKWVTKLVAQAIGIAVAPGVLLTRSTASSYAFTGPVVVKPVAAGSSHGVSLIEDEAGLASALKAALELDERVLVEKQIRGREVDVAVLARPDGTRVVAPALEIVLHQGIFDQHVKYDGSADLRVPADLAEADRKALEAAAVAMYDALGCAGVARIDFFLTADGPVLNEVNTVPGFTAQSQVPKMFAAGGTSYPDLVDLLVRDALSLATVQQEA